MAKVYKGGSQTPKIVAHDRQVEQVMRQYDVQLKRDAKHAHALNNRWRGHTGHSYSKGAKHVPVNGKVLTREEAAKRQAYNRHIARLKATQNVIGNVE